MTLTLEQFNQLATKEDLKELEERTASKKDINKILDAIDSFTKKVQDFEAEQASNLVAHDRFEGRITALESSAKAAI